MRRIMFIFIMVGLMITTNSASAVAGTWSWHSDAVPTQERTGYWSGHSEIRHTVAVRHEIMKEEERTGYWVVHGEVLSTWMAWIIQQGLFGG